MTQWFSLGRWPAWVLLGSLCLNVALGTYVAVQWYRPERLLPGVAAPPRLVERVAERLPKADAEILRRVYQGKQAEFSASQAEYMRALLASVRMLGEPKLDTGALRKAVMEARDKRLKIGDLLIETFIEAFAQMSPEGRQQLVGRIGRR